MYLQADCPDEKQLPPQDAVGVTVVLLTCSYKKLEFVRVGYYVSNEYIDPELRENPPVTPIYEQVNIKVSMFLEPSSDYYSFLSVLFLLSVPLKVFYHKRSKGLKISG